jgi:hypothetical protein
MTLTRPRTHARRCGAPTEEPPMNNPDHDFKVADLSLAPWGRKEIELAEV